MIEGSGLRIPFFKKRVLHY